jgi:proline iminopeptidase
MARSRWVTVRGNRAFEYVAQGKGPATLLVHPGGPGLTYHYLRPLLKLASSHLRVILFNPRGVGHSWKPRRASAYTLTQEAEDIEAIRARLDIKELHLLGYSAGGFAALEYAHRHPSRLTSLLLCATAGSAEEVRQSIRWVRSAATPEQRRRLRALEREKEFDSADYQALNDEIERPFSMRFLHSPPKDWKATKFNPEVYRAMMSRTGDASKIDGTIARWDGRRYYSQIEVPTLVLVGRYDYFLDASREMADRIVPAHLRVLPQSSHFAIHEQTREFIGTIREFLLDVTGD